MLCHISDCNGKAVKEVPIGKNTIMVCEKHYYIINRYKYSNGGDV